MSHVACTGRDNCPLCKIDEVIKQSEEARKRGERIVIDSLPEPPPEPRFATPIALRPIDPKNPGKGFRT